MSVSTCVHHKAVHLLFILAETNVRVAVSAAAWVRGTMLKQRSLFLLRSVTTSPVSSVADSCEVYVYTNTDFYVGYYMAYPNRVQISTR